MDICTAYEWVIERMLRHKTTGGVVCYKWTEELMDSIIENIFPENKEDALIISHSFRTNYWETKKIPFIAAKFLKVPVVEQRYKMLFFDRLEHLITDERFMQQFCELHKDAVIWIFMENVCDEHIAQLSEWKDSYVPFISLAKKATKVVRFECDAREQYVHVAYGHLLNHINRDNMLQTMTTFSTQDVFFWPEIAAIRTLAYGTDFEKQMLLPDPKISVQGPETELYHEARRAMTLWNRGYGKTEAIKDLQTLKTSSLIKAVDSYLRQEHRECVVAVPSRTHAKYLCERLSRKANIMTYKQMCYASVRIPPVVLAPLENLTDSITGGSRVLERLYETVDVTLVLFRPKDYDFVEMTNNCVYRYSPVQKYKTWANHLFLA
ncbi:unknown [Singapore grouper iridovirus]|uniref:Uncharacterized protein n=1 Tax=Singapore grouper iridovirus TaxID=262968 RepID=Q5YFH4_9VIRU|nr:hypothetical protein ORF091L [Singapore grouper iridovirus]AAS18106.1 unknown [Singapore grouper iridovirus]WAU86800.1 hypothetical protein ORF091L [Singapore grouper iridovirus]